METDAFEHLAYQILNTPLRRFPFDHTYVTDVFPKEYYKQILANLPNSEEYVAIAKLGRVPAGFYQERSLFPLIGGHYAEALKPEKREFWHTFLTTFVSGKFQRLVLHLFEETVKATVPPDATPLFYWDAFLVQDVTNYALGPHTDARDKLITCIFYLPEDDSHPGIGTSIFAPKDPNFSDVTGHHQKFEDFKLMSTMPFLPNSMFGFIRTDHSWHGVPPVAEKVVRNSITLQLRLKS